ncbi:MAG: S1/P1 nuclease [Candidatus Accumulibacter sp. UW20]|jgi:hypothetical protein
MTSISTGEARATAVHFGRLGWLAAWLVLASPALAWNAAGHRISAMIAWQQLDEHTRSAVATLLRQHPDFRRWQARGKGADEDLTAFVEASTWPDDIRQDRRFYSAGKEPATPVLAGFPDMERRQNWHYVDRPLDPAHPRTPSSGLIDRQLVTLARTLGNREARLGERVYALPWLIHLVADAHQPLHTASRYTPDGRSDRGGNAVTIYNPFNSRRPLMSLHRYWDDLPGPPWLRSDRLAAVVAALTASHPPPASGTVAEWIDESWRLAREHAYPPENDSPPRISSAFHATAQGIANRRISDAGHRLAGLLKTLLAQTRAP